MIHFKSEKLYSKSSNGQILFWQIFVNDISTIIRRGVLNGKESIYETKSISTVKDTSKAKSKVKDKRTNGYRGYEEVVPLNKRSGNIYFDLDNCLSVNKYDFENRLKPMKAKPYKKGVMVYPAFIQPKLNGHRFALSWETVKEDDGLFAKTVERAVLRTKEGHEMVLLHITDKFNKSFFNDDYTFDGEAYIHGKSLSYIHSCIPIRDKDTNKVSKVSGNPDEVCLVFFDLAIEDVKQEDRTFMLIMRCLENDIPVINIGDKYINKVYYLPTTTITSDLEVEAFRDLYIDAGYEGIIIRNISETYKFGGRQNNMLKYKKYSYTECKILDIILKNVSATGDKERSYIAFVLKNDLNNATFECTPEGDEENRLDYYYNKDSYIGKLCKVRFYERSGVKAVPFHANVIKVINQ